MKHADFFSRNPVTSNNEGTVSDAPKCKHNKSTNIVQVIDLHTDWLTVAQQCDDGLVKITAALKANELDPDVQM